MFLATKRGQLGDRPGEQANSLGRPPQRQLAGYGHLLVERLAGEGDAVAPADLDAAAVGRVAKGLRGVEVAVPEAKLVRLRLEAAAVEFPEPVQAVARIQDPEPVPGIPLDRQLEELGTFEEAIDAALEWSTS